MARLFLENGDLRRAETIITGVIEIAPDFTAAWLASAYVLLQRIDYQGAVTSAKNALRSEPDGVLACLMLVVALFAQGDYSAAGTYLGEIGEKIESGAVDDPRIIRFYKGQLARYKSK